MFRIFFLTPNGIFFLANLFLLDKTSSSQKAIEFISFLYDVSLLEQQTSGGCGKLFSASRSIFLVQTYRRHPRATEIIRLFSRSSSFFPKYPTLLFFPGGAICLLRDMLNVRKSIFLTGQTGQMFRHNGVHSDLSLFTHFVLIPPVNGTKWFLLLINVMMRSVALFYSTLSFPHCFSFFCRS